MQRYRKLNFFVVEKISPKEHNHVVWYTFIDTMVCLIHFIDMETSNVIPLLRIYP